MVDFLILTMFSAVMTYRYPRAEQYTSVSFMPMFIRFWLRMYSASALFWFVLLATLQFASHVLFIPLIPRTFKTSLSEILIRLKLKSLNESNESGNDLEPKSNRLAMFIERHTRERSGLTC